MSKLPSREELQRLEELHSKYLWAEKILESWENDPVYPSDKHDQAVAKRDDARKAWDDFAQEIKSRYPDYKQA